LDCASWNLSQTCMLSQPACFSLWNLREFFFFIPRCLLPYSVLNHTTYVSLSLSLLYTYYLSLSLAPTCSHPLCHSCIPTTSLCLSHQLPLSLLSLSLCRTAFLTLISRTSHSISLSLTVSVTLSLWYTCLHTRTFSYRQQVYVGCVLCLEHESVSCSEESLVYGGVPQEEAELLQIVVVGEVVLNRSLQSVVYLGHQ
jgi:hypothetical protein